MGNGLGCIDTCSSRLARRKDYNHSKDRKRRSIGFASVPEISLIFA